MKKHLLSLALILCILLPAIMAAADDAGPVLTFRGLRFQIILVTDDHDMMAMDSFPMKTYCMIRVRSLDGVIDHTTAHQFGWKMDVFKKEPYTTKKGKVEYTTKEWAKNPPEIITVGKTFTDFDLIYYSSLYSYDSELMSVKVEGDSNLYEIANLPDHGKPLHEEETKSIPLVTYIPQKTHTPRPTPTNTPELSPVPPPELKPMTESQRSSLIKEVENILKSQPSTRSKYNMPLLKGQVAVAVFSSDGRIMANTLDDGLNHEYFRDLPYSRMAVEYSKVDTFILVYNIQEYRWRYTDGTKGYRTYTNMAVGKGDQWTYYSIAIVDPPDTKTTLKNSPKYNSSGKYEIMKAMEQIRSVLSNNK